MFTHHRFGHSSVPCDPLGSDLLADGSFNGELEVLDDFVVGDERHSNGRRYPREYRLFYHSDVSSDMYRLNVNKVQVMIVLEEHF